MTTLTATQLPSQFALTGDLSELAQPILVVLAQLIAEIQKLEAKVAQLDDAIAAQTTAITANTEATNNAVAAMGTSGVSQAQLDAIAKNTADIQSNTVKLATATPPPVVPLVP